jgi:hypothetical protein
MVKIKQVTIIFKISTEFGLNVPIFISIKLGIYLSNLNFEKNPAPFENKNTIHNPIATDLLLIIVSKHM